ncbi:MAG TPA: glycoside hydrolase family 15 protein [Thermoplasmata archaeon]|nr:glycoside hydrolase family 15 protein [Thermoplasmata archaeon]
MPRSSPPSRRRRPLATPAAPSSGAAPGLYDYGVIGNLHTAALVSRFGSVDWACLPRFAAPSAFGRLLDWEKGGFTDIRPEGADGSHQRYLSSTNILETRFDLAGRRRLIVRDFMPIHSERSTEADPRIVRLLESTGGPVAVEIRVAPRFQYASETPTWSGEGRGWVATGPSGDRLETLTPFPAAVGDGALVARGIVNPDRRVALELRWGPVESSENAEELLTGTMTYWTEWVHTDADPIHRIAAPWHRWVERAELLLKLLSRADTGAFIAAPTTSLPEWPGASRNWDYRYVWIRDAAFAAQALLLLGHTAEAHGYLQWVVARLGSAGPPGQLRVMYDAHGESDLTERELDYLAGFAGSRPVRIGNGAADQVQLDIYGEVLDAAFVFGSNDPHDEFLATHWPMLSRLADTVVELWRLPDHGIWEIRGRRREYLHSKLMCWVALDRATRIAQRLGGDPRLDRWEVEAEEIRRTILAHGWDGERDAFVQAIGWPVLDAAVLRIPLVGLLPFDDPRVLRTVETVRARLGRGPFLRRYEGGDGFDEPEGAFLLCSFWLVECLARSGRRTLARRYFRQLLAVASPLGLYSEEYDPLGRRPLGNYPQAFTHIGVLRAALALERDRPAHPSV